MAGTRQKASPRQETAKTDIKKINLSDLEPANKGAGPLESKQIDIEEIKYNILEDLKKFFKIINISILIFMLCAFFIERIYITDMAKYIVTEKSIMAVIGSVTIQTGAIYLAAIKGLFSK